MSVSRSPEVVSRFILNLEYRNCIGSYQLFKFQVTLTENESEPQRTGDKTIALSRHESRRTTGNKRNHYTT